jgi:hypothetical protein
MVVFSCEGVRSIDPAKVIAVYRDEVMGNYCNVTLCLDDGTEVSGRALAAAVNRIEREIANAPPEAA